ncbi:uncharacterized protein [Palaemon carinicauda]|uniref:uncharacterized protein n=1 Tax=Palaemon carinicauda TaxID=392227 RepID=UPI0035B621C7
MPFAADPPEMLLFTDASKEGWGAYLLGKSARGNWIAIEKSQHINVLELRAVQRACLEFVHLLRGNTVALMCDNATVVAYKNISEVHPREKERPRRRPQQDVQVVGYEWSLHPEVARSVIQKWGSPVMDLFATKLNTQLPVFCSPVPDPKVAFEDAFQHPWDNLNVYAFPPFGMLRQVLNRGRLFVEYSNEDVGLPETVIDSCTVYQAKWATLTKWCATRDIKPLKVSIPQVADFLVYLRDVVNMSIPAIKGVRAALDQVFLLKGIDLGNSRHISMLIKSFEQSCPPQAVKVPQWDVARVLKMLSEPPFEPLKHIVDKDLTLKTVFLLALASAKRVSEIHGLSYEVAHSKGWREVTFKFVPSFVAKSQNPAVWNPRFEGFSIPAIPQSDDVKDLRLCPVRAVRKYLERTVKLRPGIKCLFVSAGFVKKPVSKNTISFWLRQVIIRAYSKAGILLPGKPNPHDIRGLSTTLAFEKNMALREPSLNIAYGGRPVPVNGVFDFIGLPERTRRSSD